MKTDSKGLPNVRGRLSQAYLKARAHREAAHAIALFVAGYQVRYVSLIPVNGDVRGSVMTSGDLKWSHVNDPDSLARQAQSLATCEAVGWAAVVRLRLLGGSSDQGKVPFEGEAPPFKTSEHEGLFEDDASDFKIRPEARAGDLVFAEACAPSWRLLQYAARFVEIYWDEIDYLAQLLLQGTTVSAGRISRIPGDLGRAKENAAASP